MRHIPSDYQGRFLAESHAAINAQHAFIPTCRKRLTLLHSPLEMVDAQLTFDDLTNTDLGPEISAADGGVESSNQVRPMISIICQSGLLLSLLVCLIFIVESAGIFHGDGVAPLCLVDAVAGADHCLRDAHVVCYVED